MNIVKTGDGRFIEMQGTAEGQPFDRRALDALMALADKGINDADRQAARGGRRRSSKPVNALLIATTNPGKVREIQRHPRRSTDRAARRSPISRHPRAGGDRRHLRGKRADQGALLRGATGPDGGCRRLGPRGRRAGQRARRPSARWHGTRLSDQVRGDLPRAGGAGPTTSAARFVAHIAVADDGTRSCSRPPASVEGEIASEPQGTHGFGYDPIFFYPPYDCTLGEVDGAKKAAVSHRGKAFRQLAQLARTFQPSLSPPPSNRA